MRSQRGVHYDETSWKVEREKQRHHAWVMTGTETPEAAFVCGKSRGKGVAEEIKGKNTNHIGITDGYVTYQNLFERHQLCWAHPQRKFRDLSQSETLDTDGRERCKQTYESFSLLYHDLREALKEPFHIEKRKKARSGFLTRLDTIAETNANDPKKLATLKESLQKNRESYFTCLLHDGIPPDNNKAERPLRHLVLKRKISFGSKTEEGAKTTSVLASVLLSLFWSKPKDFFGEYMRVRRV
ncbi:MAG TPA: transposase [Gammaproteobacteria bacterium]|nr:transposase [Gammaproteobacteria bacterium]